MCACVCVCVCKPWRWQAKDQEMEEARQQLRVVIVELEAARRDTARMVEKAGRVKVRHRLDGRPRRRGMRASKCPPRALDWQSTSTYAFYDVCVFFVPLHSTWRACCRRRGRRCKSSRSNGSSSRPAR